MNWLIELLAALAKALVPWIFSGETVQQSARMAGLPGLDAATGNRVNGLRAPLLTARDIPLLCFLIMFALCGLGALCGCAFGGARETSQTVICEPGSTVEIATDQKIKIRGVATDANGKSKEFFEKRNLGGQVSLPKSVYNVLRNNYVNQPSPAPLDATPEETQKIEAVKAKG